MKTTKILSLLSLMLFSFMTSCVNDDDYDIPTVNIEEPNITISNTISGIQTAYDESGQAVVSFSELFNLEGDDSYYIEGYVISNDEAGNIFKELIIQDAAENPTAGIRIRIDDPSLYDLYKPGRKIYINLNGLAINDYNGVYQIGLLGASSVDRISGANYTDYISRSPQMVAIVPMVITPDDYNSTPIDILVQIDNMQVPGNADGSVTYANVNDTNTVNRAIESCIDDSTIDMRNSGYADFKAYPMPTGQGSITAIFSQYNTSKQLFIRDTVDLVFNDERCDGNGGGNSGDCNFTISTESLPYTEDWSSYGSNPDYEDIVAPWISYVESGEREFSIRNFDGVNYAQLSAYNSGDAQNIAWLISPTVNMDDATEKIISFNMADAYSNGNPLTLHYSTDFDGSDCPDAFTWTEIGASEIAALNQNTGNYDNNYESTGDIDLSALSGDVTFAFIYEGGENDITTTVQISEVSIGGEGSGGGGSGNTGAVFSEDFESGTAYEDLDLAGWTNYNVNGGANVFQFRSYDSNMYAQTSAYNSSEDPYEVWLVTPSIDLTSSTSATLNFGTKDGYYNGDALTTYISTDFSGSGDPTTATWTELTGINYSTGNSGGYGDSFVNSGDIDLSAYAGQTVYIAFQYVGADGGVTTTYQIDNVEVSAN
ncbi:DUF5689 domain-containing protein [Mangrovimonas cancribranchiae]